MTPPSHFQTVKDPSNSRPSTVILKSGDYGVWEITVPKEVRDHLVDASLRIETVRTHGMLHSPELRGLKANHPRKYTSNGISVVTRSLKNTHAAGRRMKRGLHMTIQDYVAHQRKHGFLANAGVKESTDEGQRAMSTAFALPTWVRPKRMSKSCAIKTASSAQLKG
jgi:hypothetical protein